MHEDLKNHFKVGSIYRIRKDHPYHPGRLGIFEFFGKGQSEGTAVFSEVNNRRVHFAVLVTDVEPEW